MLADDAFLRRLPVTLNQEQYLRLMALVFSADTIAFSYQSIKELTAHYLNDITKISRDHRILLFTHVWTIVDHIHTCRQILSSLPFQSKAITEFVDAHKSATMMRNKMDHLNQNAGNLGNSKIPRPPVFGALSYIVVPHSEISKQENGSVITGGGIVMITAGPMNHAINMNLVNPAGQVGSPPVCLFQFQAFDQVLNLEGACESLQPIVTNVDADVEKEVTGMLQKIASDKGISIEKLKGNAAEGLVTYMEFKFENGAYKFKK